MPAHGHLHAEGHGCNGSAMLPLGVPAPTGHGDCRYTTFCVLSRARMLASRPLANTGMWKSVNAMPTPRDGHDSVTIMNKIYIAGGADGTSTGVPVLEKYNPASDTWETKNSAVRLCGPRAYARIECVLCMFVQPTAHYIGGMAHFSDFLFFIGGANQGTCWPCQDIVEVYDLDGDSWDTINSLPQGQFKLAVGTYAYNDVTTIYAVGGSRVGGAPGKEVVKYSFSTSPPAAPVSAQWQTMNDLPEQLFFHQFDLVGSEVLHPSSRDLVTFLTFHCIDGHCFYCLTADIDFWRKFLVATLFISLVSKGHAASCH